ncbi:MAG: RsmB/NOP family class I SAM-dependent RNA methyltransferase [Candidatus Heimdallarchaeota archaeon]
MTNLTSKIKSVSRKEVIKVLIQYDTSLQSLRDVLRHHFDKQSFTDEIAAAIQSLAIGIVRYQNTIDFLLSRSIPDGSIKDKEQIDKQCLRVALFEGRWHKTSIQNLESFVKTKENMEILRRAIDINLETIIKSMNQDGKNSILYSHPTFLIKTLAENLGYQKTISLMKKNNSPASSYMRVNQLISDPDAVLASLKDKDIILKQDKYFPFLYLVIDGLKTLVGTDAFKNGDVFIQDKSSVLAVTTLDPKPGEYVWDACAAPGMKTHLIWELMKGQGRLVASDISYQRLQGAQQRFQKYGHHQIDWVHTDASRTSVIKAEKILIDAPCTSTGILQSHPSYKWRLNKKWLFSIMTIQNKILNGIISRYADKPGTEILYATCSILPHEGESQIDSMMERHKIELLDGPKIGEKGYQNFKCSDKVRRLFPHIHDSNGFFIAHMRICS